MKHTYVESKRHLQESICNEDFLQGVYKVIEVLESN